MSERDPKTFGFLLLPGFPMACLTSAIEPLRAANEIGGTDTFSWTLISESGGNVKSSANVLFQPDIALAEADDLDIVFVLSGPQGRFEAPSKTNGKLRHMERHGVIMGAISGGIFPLARAGLLDGYKCSVHWCYKTAFQSEFPKLDADDDVIVLDRSRYTASGAAAGFDIMLSLIDKILGSEVMVEVACWFQHPLVRSEGVRQKIPTFLTDSTADALPPLVAQAVELYSRNLEFPISARDVAAKIGVSERQMERAFKSAVGESPGRYYRGLRMRAARQLVMYSNESFTEIAHSVGYATSSTLLQNYRAHFGISPQEERRNLNRFRVTDNRPLPSV